MKLDLSIDDVLHTTRAVRKRLDFDRPVEPEVIKECLEAAIQSPTGSNRQTWQWMVVTDADQRAELAACYTEGFKGYRAANPLGGMQTAYDGDDPVRLAQQARVQDSAGYLAENFHRVPVMLIPLLPGRLDGLSSIAASGQFGSILPGAWSFMLAARARGLGTTLTTIHLTAERRAAEALGIDFDAYTQIALITCGYTIGTDFKPATRPPIETVLHWDRWGGAAPWA